MNYLDTLSHKGSFNFKRFGECRLDNKNHFDNGTTATLIPIYNPFTNESRTPRGTLPFSMKPEHTSTVPNYPWTAADTLPSSSDAENTEQCLIWQLKSIALEYIIPELAHPKPLLESSSQAEQFPLSAMHEDESTLEGTITVINKLFEQLKASSADLEDHGLVEGARRNSTDPLESMQPLVRRLGIFHAKMAGNCLIVNEHWGKLNATIPGGKVYSSLYTTAAYDDACTRNEATRDAAFENSVLYNRDSLLYLLLVSSIKAGDIDDPVLQNFFLHNWLVNITGIINRFKEVDLLQEHQNFWVKIVYNAKGVNRSWSWLGRITVCIFALHDAMKTVHATFKIPDYGTKHTVPDMQNEILHERRHSRKIVSRSCGPTDLGRIKFAPTTVYSLVPPGSNMEGANAPQLLMRRTQEIMSGPGRPGYG
ncbi:hypothetical protein B0H14DRAFT_2639941 [Mycena olivaceomarginata]|nr:hypothetical protein B0H14DRAFT_2639941 [Mycena olivaceomarginata]